jgi:hypothetical protein
MVNAEKHFFESSGNPLSGSYCESLSTQGAQALIEFRGYPGKISPNIGIGIDGRGVVALMRVWSFSEITLATTEADR